MCGFRTPRPRRCNRRRGGEGGADRDLLGEEERARAKAGTRRGGSGRMSERRCSAGAADRARNLAGIISSSIRKARRLMLSVRFPSRAGRGGRDMRERPSSSRRSERCCGDPTSAWSPCARPGAFEPTARVTFVVCPQWANDGAVRRVLGEARQMMIGNVEPKASDAARGRRARLWTIASHRTDARGAGALPRRDPGAPRCRLGPGPAHSFRGKSARGIVAGGREPGSDRRGGA